MILECSRLFAKRTHDAMTHSDRGVVIEKRALGCYREEKSKIEKQTKSLWMLTLGVACREYLNSSHPSKPSRISL